MGGLINSDYSEDDFHENRNDQLIQSILYEAGGKKGKLVDESLNESC